MSVILNNRYRIVRTLGSGGFGDTFLSEDTHMPSARKCVVKQLKPSTNDPKVWQIIQDRFQREAAILEVLGKANHQIPELFAYFTENDKFYLVQEYVEGATLAQEVASNGALGELRVRGIVSSLLQVLEFVHSQGVIHRDIKPDNIIIRKSDGQPVLIDFGAVKEVVSSNLDSQGYTTSSIRIGSPGFMPLEQAAGKPVFSSDLYSLGLTAVYMLTGKLPQALSDFATGEIKWQEHVPGISQSFAAAINKAIENQYRDRFKTAREMIEAVEDDAFHASKTYIDEQTAPVAVRPTDNIAIDQQTGEVTVDPLNTNKITPTPRRTGRWIAALVIPGCLIAIGAASLWYYQNSRSNPSEILPSASSNSASLSPVSSAATNNSLTDSSTAKPEVGQSAPSPAPPMEPAISVAGRWIVSDEENKNGAKLVLTLKQDGNKVSGNASGDENGKKVSYPLTGEITANRIRLTYSHKYTKKEIEGLKDDQVHEGDQESVVMTGIVDGRRMSGSGTYRVNKKVKGGGRWSALKS